MEKKGLIYELIIQAIYAILSLIGIIIALVNIFLMLPLFKSFGEDEAGLYTLIYNSPIGPIFKSMGVIESINSQAISLALTSFLNQMSLLCIIYLFFSIILLIIYFVFPRWKFISLNLKVSILPIISYLLKYILFALSFVIFYKDNDETLAFSIVFGNVLFILMSLCEIFFLGIFVLRFVIFMPKALNELKKM